MSVTQLIDVAAIAGDLKHELFETISLVLTRYRKEYGLTPSSIDINMAENTGFGDRTKTFVVEDVSLDFTF